MKPPRAAIGVYAVLAVLALAAPLIGLYPVFVMKMLCYALFACAFNLLLGYTRMLSFGHAAFFGAAAYVTGWLISTRGWSTLSGIAGGVVVALLLGAVIGAIAVRRRGIYFAMITLALAQLVYFICLESSFTGGENGLQAIPRGNLFGFIDLGRDGTMYYFVLAIFVAAYLLIRRIVQSPFGQVLKAIRENEPRAISLGYRVDRYKLLAFVLSAGLAGLAGALKALVLGFATLSDVSQGTSGDVILMTMLGGSGTWATVVIGVIFVVCVMVFRRGFVGEIERRFGRTSSSETKAG